MANNAIFEVPNPLNYREDLVRIDYRINDKHTPVRPLDRRLQFDLSGLWPRQRELFLHSGGCRESQPPGKERAAFRNLGDLSDGSQ